MRPEDRPIKFTDGCVRSYGKKKVDMGIFLNLNPFQSDIFTCIKAIFATLNVLFNMYFYLHKGINFGTLKCLPRDILRLCSY